MNTLIYLILFFVVIGLLLFGAYETLPKIMKLNKAVNKGIQELVANDKTQLNQIKLSQRKQFLMMSQIAVLAIVITIFIFSIIFPEMANSYVLIIMFIVEAFYIYSALQLPTIEKKLNTLSKEVTHKKLQVVRLTFFSAVGFFVAVDVLLLIVQLLYSQNFRLL
ncbi:MAG: hypothetical protein M3Z82_07405 [Apilactobacillus sp.]|nr:hypothetical protein [Apilactobacillus sp.]